MITTRRLTIIPSDGAVYTDSGAQINLDLSSCGVPENIHALQWNNPVYRNKSVLDAIANLPYGEGTGWIEFEDSIPNQEIFSLPEWAIQCFDVYVSNSTPSEPTSE